MDERAALPVSLPRANPTISYWQDPSDPEIADYLSSEQVPEAADTVIIGSGITGSFVAWNLFQSPDHGRIVMLEARQACSGATGRNGNSSTQFCKFRMLISNRRPHKSSLLPLLPRQRSFPGHRSRSKDRLSRVR
jgi:hypothetical protein